MYRAASTSIQLKPAVAKAYLSDEDRADKYIALAVGRLFI